MDKQCHKCRELKPLTEFYTNKSRSGGYQSECKLCSRAATQEYRRKNPDKIKAYRHRKWRENLSASRKYMRERRFYDHHGVTVEEADARIAAQNNLCALCGEPMGPRGSGKYGAVLDHCHSSNVTRAVLHSNCNCLIGFAKDSVPLLRHAIVYLEKYADC